MFRLSSLIMRCCLSPESNDVSPATTMTVHFTMVSVSLNSFRYVCSCLSSPIDVVLILLKAHDIAIVNLLNRLEATRLEVTNDTFALQSHELELSTSRPIFSADVHRQRKSETTCTTRGDFARLSCAVYSARFADCC
jgi:hypothetical protein